MGFLFFICFLLNSYATSAFNTDSFDLHANEKRDPGGIDNQPNHRDGKRKLVDFLSSSYDSTLISYLIVFVYVTQ